MVKPEVSTKSASQNVVALKNKMGHQLDAAAASADEADDRLMVVNFFPAETTPLPRHMGETGL